MVRLASLIALVSLQAVQSPQALAQDTGEGERLFRTRCSACHTVQPGQNRIGPHLANIVGRAAGGVEGARYSAALQRLGITWGVADIDRYLANPRAMVPGTTMTTTVPNASERAEIVAYLQSLAAPANPS